MLSLNKDKGNKYIAEVTSKKEKSKKSIPINVYVKSSFDKDAEPELDTTQETKTKIFKDFLNNMKKPLSKEEISKLLDCYKSDKEPSEKDLLKVFRMALSFVNDSLKRFLDFSPKDGEEIEIIPKMEDSFACFVSGASGAGKSYFINQLIKANPPKGKDAGIFLIGPFGDDVSYKGIAKDMVHLDLEKFDKEYGCPFTIDCFPKGSILIMDDIESMSNKKELESIRDKLLAVRRHYELTMICVNHVGMAGAATKKMLLECQYYIVFPKANKTHATKLMKAYVGLDNEQVNLINNQNTRWVCLCKAFPMYFVTQTSIGLL